MLPEVLTHVVCVLYVNHVTTEGPMGARNLTIRLDDEVIQKARIVAARRGTSISKLVASTIEDLVSEDDDYHRAMSSALAAMEEGFAMGSGGRITWRRDELHER